MKRIALALFAAAGLAASVAHADSRFSATVHISNGPSVSHVAPMPVRHGGHWRDISYQVWVPPHWAVRHDRWGHPVRVWMPGHYETRVRREWVASYGRHGWSHRDHAYGWGRHHDGRGHRWDRGNDRNWDRGHDRRNDRGYDRDGHRDHDRGGRRGDHR